VEQTRRYQHRRQEPVSPMRMENILRNRKFLILLILAAALVTLYFISDRSGPGIAEKPAAETHAAASARGVELSESQMKQVKVQAADEHAFSPLLYAVGNIAFNDDHTVQVFPAYQGKILEIFTDVGKDVQKGQPLYSIDSPDLLQAESTLIAVAGTQELTSRALERSRQLYELQGIAQKDLQQAVSDQQTAEAAYKAAVNNVRIFGKSDAEIQQIVSQRRIDSALVVRSPISGKVVSRNAAPGLTVQPGTLPAPFAVADLSVMWMLANVTESDIPEIRIGQPVKVKVMAYPEREFRGTVIKIGATVDPNTHRVAVRSEIRDPKHELLPGMLANFVISTSKARSYPAVPINSVVREGDGTVAVWVTQDERHFLKRPVKIGLQQDSLYQILSGLQVGEKVASEGAIFLSHAFEMESQ
jgi:cobalt-zinc-cadmium efflux system membrane fusion protein